MNASRRISAAYVNLGIELPKVLLYHCQVPSYTIVWISGDKSSIAIWDRSLPADNEVVCGSVTNFNQRCAGARSTSGKVGGLESRPIDL